MIVTGIDPGTQHAGVATIELYGDKVAVKLSYHVQRWKGEDEAHFLNRLGIEMINQVKPRPGTTSLGCDMVACEAAHYRLNHKTHAALAKAVGVVEQQAAALGLPFIELQPAQWKKATTGSGNADYSLIRRMIAAQVGSDIYEASEHVVAAIGIAIAAGRQEETRRKIEAAESKEGKAK